MVINGLFNGRRLKITTDTLLAQFRKTFGSNSKSDAGRFNFLVEFSMSSQSDAGTPEQAEALLNQLAGAARCFSDNSGFDFNLRIQAIPSEQVEMAEEVSRLAQAQIEAVEAVNKPSLSVPNKKIIIPGAR